MPAGFSSESADLGEITRNVLDLADPEQDFTTVLDRLFDEHGSADRVAELFDSRLGLPAMAYLYALEDDASADDDL